MAKKLKRFGALVMALVMCASMLVTPAAAAITLDNGNIWRGDELKVDITAGTEGYTFMSIWNSICGAFEMSGHVVGGEIPQTFVVVDTEKYDGQTWTPGPAGDFDPMNSNFDVTYCCDVETMMVDGVYYKRLNLEDSEYYSAEQAAKIRAIVTNAYPYVALEDMKARLAAGGFEGAEKLERDDIIAAVQAAVWAVANDKADSMGYMKSFWVADNAAYGRPLHETGAEREGIDVRGSRKTKVYPEVGALIESLTAYLLKQTATYADKAQIIITKLELDGTPVAMNDGTVKVKLDMELNSSGSGYEDDINITVYANGEELAIIPVEPGKVKYTAEFIVNYSDKITAIASGTQVLPRGVYFYAPKEADVDGDGIATSREVSQNLVGAAMGPTAVYAKAELEMPPAPPTPPTVSFKSGEASNISFMLIDKATGEVEFLKKIDIGSETSFEIPTEEGKISAVFIKQSTSGMFWIAEKVDEAIQEAVIECLKDHNPSYKGHNAFCFGEGDHTLEFKKDKFATYTFDNIPAVTAAPAVEETVEEPVVEETVEEPVVEETVAEEPAEEPVVEETVAEETVETPVVEETVAEEPVEEPVVEETETEEPAVEETEAVEEELDEKEAKKAAKEAEKAAKKANKKNK